MEEINKKWKEAVKERDEAMMNLQEVNLKLEELKLELKDIFQKEMEHVTKKWKKVVKEREVTMEKVNIMIIEAIKKLDVKIEEGNYKMEAEINRVMENGIKMDEVRNAEVTRLFEEKLENVEKNLKQKVIQQMRK